MPTTINDFIASTPLTMHYAMFSAALSMAAFLPYIVNTLVGRTRPQRASWFIWSIMSTIAFFSQLAEGADTSRLFIGAQMCGTVAVFALSLFMGRGVLLQRTDIPFIAGAAIGLALKYMTDNPTYALVITIFINLLAGIPTIRKAYYDPASETLSMWTISLAASICGVLSVGSFDWILLAYPLYLVGLYAMIVGAMIFSNNAHWTATPN
jgi:hypothetical protein